MFTCRTTCPPSLVLLTTSLVRPAVCEGGRRWPSAVCCWCHRLAPSCVQTVCSCVQTRRRGTQSPRTVVHPYALLEYQICGGAIGCYCCINLGLHRADSWTLIAQTLDRNTCGNRNGCTVTGARGCRNHSFYPAHILLACPDLECINHDERHYIMGIRKRL